MTHTGKVYGGKGVRVCVCVCGAERLHHTVCANLNEIKREHTHTDTRRHVTLDYDDPCLCFSTSVNISHDMHQWLICIDAQQWTPTLVAQIDGVNVRVAPDMLF